MGVLCVWYKKLRDGGLFLHRGVVRLTKRSSRTSFSDCQSRQRSNNQECRDRISTTLKAVIHAVTKICAPESITVHRACAGTNKYRAHGTVQLVYIANTTTYSTQSKSAAHALTIVTPATSNSISANSLSTILSLHPSGKRRAAGTLLSASARLLWCTVTLRQLQHRRPICLEKHDGENMT